MRRLLIMIALLLFATSLALAQSTDDHANDRAYIRQAESDWAESVVPNDVSVLVRILADDFLGVDIDGSHYSKPDAIKDYRNQSSGFVSNHLNEVEIRFYGDAAVAQGNESWKKKDGTTGKFVWTDTWIRRGGKWQIVAAEDLVPSAVQGTATIARSETRAADLAAIEKLHKADVEATLTQDPKSLTALWSEEGVKLDVAGPPVVGIKALGEMYEKVQAEYPEFKVLKYAPEFKDIQIADGWAIEVGSVEATYSMSAKADPVIVPRTEGMRLLKRQSDGSWKFALVGLK